MKPSLELYSDHDRHWQQNKFIYPVLSRRSRGISLGVNLNPDKVCNFDCIYCQVDRRSEAETRFVETDRLFQELDSLLRLVTSGELYRDEKFRLVPADLQRLNDIAFSGDGEPTSFRNFPELVERTAELKRRHGLTETRLVLITNASLFHRPAVQRGLRILDENQGEIWAKLDAGTEAYYQLIERTKIPFAQVLNNITSAARERPLVIQSIFMNVRQEPPSAAEIAAYCDRLNDVRQAGGQLQLVQIYTVARLPAESYVTALSDGQVDEIAATVRQATGLNVAAYYGRTFD